MNNKKVLGWISLIAFVLAVLILLFLAAVLLFSIPLPNFPVDGQVLLIISGGLGLFAALFGLASRQVIQGKIGGLGGLTVFVLVAILLSFTLITRVETTVG